MKQAITYEEIIEAKRGSEAALAAIIAREMPLIRRFARKAVGPGLDFDDAVQEGIIGLFRAIEEYREGQGASFTTYASVCIQNNIIEAQRAAGRKKHSPLNHSVPIPREQSIPGPEDQAIASEEVNITLEKAKKHLSLFEMQVLRMLVMGYSRAEMAELVGKDIKAIDNALLRVRKKL